MMHQVDNKENTTNRLRVLVSAHTNIAVDRILLGLIDSGFTDFIRVGSLPKISKSVLKYSLHCGDTDGSMSTSGVEELKKMLKECNDQEEKVILKCVSSSKVALQKLVDGRCDSQRF